MLGGPSGAAKWGSLRGDGWGLALGREAQVSCGDREGNSWGAGLGTFRGSVEGGSPTLSNSRECEMLRETEI